MADDDAARRPDDRDPTCPPCRGAGQVISRLGGEEHSIPCPWCGGTGRWEPGRNAQEAGARSDAPDSG